MAPKKELDARAVALGSRIRRLRARAGLTQDGLASRLNRHVNTIGSWERGEKVLGAIDLPMLAAALQTDVATILGDRTELGLQSGRREKSYLVLRDNIKRVRAAKSLEELNDLFSSGIRYAHIVEENAEEVTFEEWGKIEQSVEGKLARLGFVPGDARLTNAYHVSRRAVDRIEAATSIDDLRDLFTYGISFGSLVPPDSERVSKKQYDEQLKKAEAKIAQLGGIPEEWLE